MRFTIALQARPGGGWTSEVRDATGAVLAGSTRGLEPLPLPDPDETLLLFPACASPLADGAADADALHALDATTLATWYANMASGQSSDGMPRHFGRYLFELVLGSAAWTEITTVAAGAPIDLRIACAPGDWALMRLPWELMHDGQHFLAARPGPLVLMSREIIAVGGSLAPRRFAPRVLFVIGSLVGDAEIRAGAEYLGLLRRLQALDLTLDCRVLRDANAERLQTAIAGFQPSVVHFICHGGFTEGRGSLRLLPSDAALPFQDYTAPQLLNLLATTNQAGDVSFPPVVILNACYSATPPAPGATDPVDQLSASEVLGNGSGVLPVAAGAVPLGAELVAGDGAHGGPALVIGMGGRVADLACRLFTRQFYQSLLRGDPTWSAAAGRRGAFTHGFDPRDTIDWATPVVFVESRASLEVDASELDLARRRAIVAHQLRSQDDPPAFCGRLAYFDDWREITREIRGPSRRLLGISISDTDPEKRVGGSRLLEELAVAAIHCGHVPCLRVHREASPERPSDLSGIAREILAAALDIRVKYGLAPHDWNPEVIDLHLHLRDSTLPLPLPVARALAISQADAFRTALQRDLWRVRDDVATHMHGAIDPARRPLVVVLLDEVQRYAGAAGRFVADLLRAGGLGTDQDPIPVAFTYRKDLNYAEPYEQVRKALDAVSNWAIRQELHPLREAATDRSIYLHLLLQRTPPLVPAPNLDQAKLDDWLGIIHDATAMGYPSQLKSTADGLRVALRACKMASVIIEADDEQVLAALGK
ncbi:MAG TPA: CHAT domain-containing protein [Luteitalea sp.]|nr:CHAT domain-containing protein [Luteitalea sp.]